MTTTNLKKQFAGKVAVVTGGTQGLGEAVARMFAARGAAGIVICGRNARRGKAVAASLTKAGTRAVFVKADCAPCAQRVQQLQAAGTAFDLYMVGSRQDDARIRQWATQAGIDPARVRARTITLNHDAGRWLSLGLPGDLPAVVREVNGQWQRQ